jgi:hypothetical protein
VLQQDINVRAPVIDAFEGQSVFTECSRVEIEARVGPGKLLPELASTVILGSESRGTHDHILSHYSGSRATRLM